MGSQLEGKSNGKPNGKMKAAAARESDAGEERDGIPVPPEMRCKHRNAKGTPCRAARRKDSKFCIFHDMEFQKRHNEMKAARKMLDRRKAPDTAEGIHALLLRNIEELRGGKIEPRVANSIAYHAQILMANLRNLKHERAELIPSSIEQRFQELLVDAALEECEKEIRKAGDNAYPAVVARRTADQAKERAAQQVAASVAPIPVPRVREIAPGVQEVIGPRGMPVSFGRAEPEEE